MEAISLRFRYTEEEYVAATRLYLTRSTDILLRIVFSSIFLAVGIFFGLLAALGSESLFPPIIAGLLSFLFWPLFFYVAPRQRFRSDPKFRDEYFLQFSDDGIQFRTAQIDSLLQWSLYNKVLENERFYILVYGKNMMSVIPKRAFASRNDEAAFKEMLGRNLPAYSDPKQFPESKPSDVGKSYVPPAAPPDWH